MFLNFPKNQQKIWQISALESKKWSNHKITAPYIVFNTLNSPYNHSIIRKCLYFLDLTTLGSGAEIFRFFFFFFFFFFFLFDIFFFLLGNYFFLLGNSFFFFGNFFFFGFYLQICKKLNVTDIRTKCFIQSVVLFRNKHYLYNRIFCSYLYF